MLTSPSKDQIQATRERIERQQVVVQILLEDQSFVRMAEVGRRQISEGNFVTFDDLKNEYGVHAGG